MDWYERARTSALSRIHGTPLPRGDTRARVVFQSWHYFDSDVQQWTPARATSTADDGGIPARDKDVGPVWRASFPSRFGRDALCCDIFTPSPNSFTRLTRTRLINVHLDSLPISPSYRPRQVSIISRFLRSAGRGLAAGDFNPVLEEDASLVERHGLIDAWEAVHPGQPGCTWGTDGKQAYPPTRLDKAVLFELRPHDIKVVEAKRLSNADGQATDSENNSPWSDHHGLLCSFESMVE